MTLSAIPQINTKFFDVFDQHTWKSKIFSDQN